MNYIITDVREEHLDKIEKIEKLCFSIPWTREQLRSQLPDEQHVFLAAEQDGKAVGYVGMAYVLDEGYISNVAVDPGYRKAGIADALIDELLHRSEELALSFVTLEVRRSNAPAISLYRKHGFEKVAERKNYYDLPREDAILMTRYLK